MVGIGPKQVSSGADPALADGWLRTAGLSEFPRAATFIEDDAAVTMAYPVLMVANHDMTKRQRRALVVDDHPLFCDALELTLRTAAQFAEIATADTLSKGLELLKDRGRHDLIVLDLNLPDVTGLEGLIRLRTQAPETPVIVVSSMAENAMISAAMEAGASGFVPKHSPHGEFRTALDAILGGQTYLPESFVECEASPDRSDAVTRLSTLTAQQARILELICDGKLNKQIAYELSIAETTVKAHVTAIMRKLSVQSRTQAVLVAQQAKFSTILPRSET